MMYQKNEHLKNIKKIKWREYRLVITIAARTIFNKIGRKTSTI